MSALAHFLGVMQLNEASLHEAKQLFAHIATLFSAITQALSYADQTSTTPEAMLRDAELKQTLYSSQTQAAAIQQILSQGNEAVLVAQVQDAETPELLRLGALLGLENSSSPIIESHLIQLGQDETLDNSSSIGMAQLYKKVRRRLVKIQKGASMIEPNAQKEATPHQKITAAYRQESRLHIEQDGRRTAAHHRQPSS